MVMILTDSPEEGQLFADVVREHKGNALLINPQEDLRERLLERQVHGIFLILRQVSEQGFAAAIKVRSMTKGTIPLIAAGPQWTRRTVLQAVKYGICDILVTPAGPEDIRSKLLQHISPRAAEETQRPAGA